jgi:TonB-dependent SusC/RagA subfamily outer membrane receptor
VRFRLTDAAGRPAAGALVRLDHTPHQGAADSAGVVELAGLAPGPYTGSAVDPRLAALGLARPAPLRVTAAGGATAEARAEVQTAEAFVAARCARDAPPNASAPSGTAPNAAAANAPGALLLGRVEGAGGRPAGGARWQVLDPRGRVLASGGPVGRDGLFQWCGLPRGTPVRVEAWRDAPSPAAAAAVLEAFTLVRVALDAPRARARGGPDTSSVAVGGGRTLERLFAGRFPGVDVSPAPGGGLRIRIRGGSNSFLASEEPLYVVDGTPLAPGTGGIVFLNPYDIEQIEVLKNPADVGIYGVRGGNGVVRITTVQPR